MNASQDFDEVVWSTCNVNCGNHLGDLVISKLAVFYWLGREALVGAGLCLLFIGTREVMGRLRFYKAYRRVGL